MPRNVEIKAVIPFALDAFLKVAKSLSDKDATVLNQEDTFYRVPNGRLKLRKQEGVGDHLVFYDRADVEGPKLSNFELCAIPENSNLGSVLSQALGTIGIVRKRRTLYMVGQTRIHVDEVEGLGNFMELEVVLKDEQTAEEGQQIAEGLMKSLGISEDNLVKGAYMDCILKSKDSSS